MEPLDLTVACLVLLCCLSIEQGHSRGSIDLDDLGLRDRDLRMSGRDKFFVYLAGVVLGCVILFFVPRRATEAPHPWVAQEAPDDYYPRSVEDALGRELTLTRQPYYFVSLAPSLTEMIDAMGMGDHLMAITDFCEAPSVNASIERIGGIRTPNLEKLVKLQPDIVLGTTLTQRSVYDQIERLGGVAVCFEAETLSAVRESIVSLGKLLGVPRKAMALRQKMDADWGAVVDALASVLEPRTVLMLYDLDGLFSAGRGSWVGEIITAARGRNLAEGQASAWPKLSLESILVIQPEVVIVALEPEAMAQWPERLRILKSDPVWSQVKAVQTGQMYALPKALFDIPGVHIADTLAAVAQCIHPECFLNGEE
jgi:iron complex transport system substrate-binding protein